MRLFDCPFAGGKAALIGQEEVQNAGLPRALELRARGRAQQAHPAARPERLGQVDVRRVHGRGAGALLDARRGRALPVQLDLPVAEAGEGRHRLRRRRRRHGGDAAETLRVPRRRADRRAARRRDARPPAVAGARAERARADRPRRSRGRPAATSSLGDYLLHGELSPQEPQIFEALLAATTATTSRCCATSRSSASTSRAATAPAASRSSRSWRSTRRERQITMDRSLAALPPALQSVVAVRVLRRAGRRQPRHHRVSPTCSSARSRPTSTCSAPSSAARVAGVATLFLDNVFIGSSNEIHLAAFKEIPEFQSFKGRHRAGARAVPPRRTATSSRSTQQQLRRGRRAAATSRRTARTSPRCGRC